MTNILLNTLMLFGGIASGINLSDSKEAAEYLKKQINLLQETKENPERMVKEARLRFYLGKFTVEPNEKEEILEKGVLLARDVRKKDPNNSGAILWWAANQGELIKLRKMSALYQIKKVEEALKELNHLNPSYEHFASHRALGRVYQEAPTFLSVGDMDKARSFLSEALIKEPDYPANKVYFAHYLKKSGDKGGATKLAQEVLALKSLNEYPLELQYDWVLSLHSILKSED